MNNDIIKQISKWNFMMDYCKDNGYNPSNEFFWDLAEKAWKDCQEGNNEN